MREDLIYDICAMPLPPAALLLRTLMLGLRLYMELALAVEEVHEGEANEEVSRPVERPQCELVEELQDKRGFLVVMNLEVIQAVHEDSAEGDQCFHKSQEHSPDYDELQVLRRLKFRSVSPILLIV